MAVTLKVIMSLKRNGISTVPWLCAHSRDFPLPQHLRVHHHGTLDTEKIEPPKAEVDNLPQLHSIYVHAHAYTNKNCLNGTIAYTHIHVNTQIHTKTNKSGISLDKRKRWA